MKITHNISYKVIYKSYTLNSECVCYYTILSDVYPLLCFCHTTADVLFTLNHKYFVIYKYI